MIAHCESIARDTIVDPEFTLLLEPLLRHIGGLCAARLDREPRHCRLQLLLHLLLRRLVLHLSLNPNAQSTAAAAAQLRVHLVANRSVQVASFALNSISIHRYDINIYFECLEYEIHKGDRAASVPGRAHKILYTI